MYTVGVAKAKMDSTPSRSMDGTELEVYCDMTSDGGGWTLLVTSESQGGTWDDDTVVLLNADSPSITSDYSILQYANSMKNTDADTFEYMIDANLGRYLVRTYRLFLCERQSTIRRHLDDTVRSLVLR